MKAQDLQFTQLLEGSKQFIIPFLGRWGNGNTEILFEKVEDLPYIIGLVRQSLEQQLGDDESES